MGSQPQPAPSEQAASFVARQPILSSGDQVFGYELSFQRNPQAQLSSAESEGAAIIETLNFIGLNVLCDGRCAFIPCTQEMLLTDCFELLPVGVVLEIQETVAADEAVLAVCQRLKESGYLVALDNFVPNDPRELLVPYGDFIKVDIKKVLREQSAVMVARYANQKCRMLAYKVETRQDVDSAQTMGYTLLQGYFFRHVEHVRTRRIPANQTTYLRLLQAISKPEVDFSEIEGLIKHEPALCYRLLRYLNSPLLGLPSTVLSIRHAFNVLGERELVRWIRMASTMAMGQGKCSDLVLSSLVRARFCELIGPKLKLGRTDLYLMGLLSLMDAIVEVPIGVIIEELPLDSITKEQLLCGKTSKQTVLSPVYDLMLAREAGDWEKVTKLCKELSLSLVFVNSSYNEAMRWTRQLAE